MNILFNASHPANFHLFKNAMDILQQKGHKVLLTVIDKDVLGHLISSDPLALKFDCRIVGRNTGNIINKFSGLIQSEVNLLKISKEFKPDILVGACGNLYVAHVGKVLGKPSIIFDTNENAFVQHCLTDPFASVICTPSCYTKNLGAKQVKYAGYHELAYLHPNYFQPNPEVIDEVGLSKNDKFTVIRLVSWNAIHDIGEHGIKNTWELVQEIEKKSEVLISSEIPLSNKLENYRIKISPNKFHDLLYYASLYIGEGSTTASECSILGTHAIYINTIQLGYTIEQEKKYDLLYHFAPKAQDMFVAYAIKLLDNSRLREEGKLKRKRLLLDKIDVTRYMVWFIEEYPRSYSIMKTTPKYQEYFK